MPRRIEWEDPGNGCILAASKRALIFYSKAYFWKMRSICSDPNICVLLLLLSKHISLVYFPVESIFYYQICFSEVSFRKDGTLFHATVKFHWRIPGNSGSFTYIN